jgi:hypothetical protein
VFPRAPPQYDILFLLTFVLTDRHIKSRRVQGLSFSPLARLKSISSLVTSHGPLHRTPPYSHPPTTLLSPVPLSLSKTTASRTIVPGPVSQRLTQLPSTTYYAYLTMQPEPLQLVSNTIRGHLSLMYADSVHYSLEHINFNTATRMYYHVKNITFFWVASRNTGRFPAAAQLPVLR